MPTDPLDAELEALDKITPESHPAQDATHFRRIIAARKAVEDAEAELRQAVDDARTAGNSWTVIGAALDTSRQAAFQRFGQSHGTTSRETPARSPKASKRTEKAKVSKASRVKSARP